MLIEKGADVNAIDRGNRSALWAAVNEGNTNKIYSTITSILILCVGRLNLDVKSKWII